MLTKKCLGAALVCALALGAYSGAAFANPINVDGVVVDPASVLNLNIQAINFRESTATKVGDTIMGYGQIASINGTDAPTFCPDCDLTFTFSYTVSSIDDSGANPQVVFNAGSVDLYVQSDGSFNVLDPTSINTSNLWLSFAGHDSKHTGFTTIGQLFSTISGTIDNPTNGSSGFGLLDATGGPAQYLANFNDIADGLGGFADMSLDSSFQVQGANICSGGICYPITGEGAMIGKAMPVSVPEPGELGLLGLGLAGLGFLVGWRRKEAKGRR